jgi:hypothetical protein
MSQAGMPKHHWAEGRCQECEADGSRCPFPPDPPHICSWCPPEPRGLFAFAYNAVLANDMWEAGTGSEDRARRKFQELRLAVLNIYQPEVNAHFDALEKEKNDRSE